jgi:hypothetical protein
MRCEYATHNDSSNTAAKACSRRSRFSDSCERLNDLVSPSGRDDVAGVLEGGESGLQRGFAVHAEQLDCILHHFVDHGPVLSLPHSLQLREKIGLQRWFACGLLYEARATCGSGAQNNYSPKNLYEFAGQRLSIFIRMRSATTIAFAMHESTAGEGLPSH